jgi:RNA polymerase sigma-70 factor (family 1)
MKSEVGYTEKDILLLTSKGDEEAFTQLFYLYKDKLYSYLIQLTKSEELTLDFIQDIFLKLWTNRANVKDIENPGSYIFRMAKNQAMNSFKRSMNESLILAKLPVTKANDNSIEADFDLKVLETKLNNVLRGLPPRQRLIFSLSREHGFKHEQIAKQLHISPVTVKNQLVKALRKIRESYQKNH